MEVNGSGTYSYRPRSEPAVAETTTSTADGVRGSDDDQLLADVNSALLDITDAQSQQPLSSKQLRSLVRLENRVRASLAKQQQDLRTSIARQQVEFTRARRRVLTGDPDKPVREFARQRVRKVVTGDSERPLHEWAQQANVVKTVDKFSFCLGVLVLCVTEYTFLIRPEAFGLYYVGLISVMMALRLYMYARSRYLYFLLDFCYWANAACFVSVLFLPENRKLWRLNFAVSNGVLLGALLAWRNSLVFHSLDKVTSISIHILPGLLTFTQRWSYESKMCDPPTNSGESVCESLGISGSILEPLLFYAVWQTVYIFKTEIIDRKRMLADPTIQTSLRWLTRDRKNAMHKIAKQVCRAIGVLKPEEEFDPEALKTKLVFWIGQLLFTVVTLLPTHFLFVSKELHMAYILYTFAYSVWSGANYYFEVFAARYIQELEATENRRKISTTTTKVD
mmetsp:Transcript_11309/g.24483  ORF Transcript_11309/g.24483 Transcript_11309/m.24483 type:complete len:450 (+) Transcript_11309:90-1439(+)